MQRALIQLIGIVIAMLKPEHVAELLDFILDKIEDLVSRTDNKIDDAIVLPLCNTIRAGLNIPDNDEETATDEETTTDE
ncbi:MAG: hypothetical protein K9M45_01650 [Kiritimatiellales bacterium]|nr:hypothetical protein [Kiritimatiellales bacterium]